jgi:hypothetical protein
VPGARQKNPREMATIILDAVGNFCSRNQTANLALVQIVVFQPEMLQCFADSIKKQMEKNSSLWTKTKGW